MAKINQDLIERIAKKLGVTHRAVYLRIAKIAKDTVLERDLAAIELARRNDINFHRFSTPGQRSQIRNARGGDDQERPPTESAAAPRRSPVRKAKAVKKSKGKTVFVVHGRDTTLRKSMFDFLRALGLHPLEWDHAIATAKGANPYVGDILEAVMEKAQAVVVLLSPDDLACLKEQFCAPDERSSEGKMQGQARPNVLFEAGLALGAHPSKTLLVQVGKVKPFSDVSGKHMVRLTDERENRNSLVNRLSNLGLDVDRVGNDWLSVGTFEPTDPKPRKRKPAR